jgi:hypothetical protein
VKIATNFWYTQFAPNSAAFARIFAQRLQQYIIFTLINALRILELPTAKAISLTHFLTSVATAGQEN